MKVTISNHTGGRREGTSSIVLTTYQIINWKIKAIQNHAFPNAPAPAVISGDIGPGPILFGAKALAQIVAREPMTCETSSVKQICIRVRVCKRIMPKPRPCSASITPSHNQRLRETKAPET